MNDDDLSIIGEHYGLGRAASSVFGIARADRRQGLHLIGQSGTGKSELMLRMLVADIERGDGVTLIDPHGLLAERLLEYIPSDRIKDVCYFNVADAERPVPFNILETNLPPEKQHLVVSAVVAAFSGIWKLTPDRAPRLLNILKSGSPRSSKRRTRRSSHSSGCSPMKRTGCAWPRGTATTLCGATGSIPSTKKTRGSGPRPSIRS